MTTSRRLDKYENRTYSPGGNPITRCLWYFISLTVFESGWLPLSAPKRSLLRLFGASIGKGVVLKPHIRIKYPWRLHIGNHSWLGQDVWIDNLDNVHIGEHSVVSQGAYLCTGSHDHRSPTFELKTAPIFIGDGAWICAKSIILPGSTVEDNKVVRAGTIFSGRQPNPTNQASI